MLFWNIRLACRLLKGLCLGTLALSLFLGMAARAQDMMEVNPLKFGEFALKNNNLQHEIIVNAATGFVTSDPAFVLASPAPQRGEYFLDNFPTATTINVTVAPGSLTLGGGPPPVGFTVSNYTVHPNPVVTDGSGRATVWIGATLRSTGDTVMVDSGTYEADLDITFDW